MIDKLQEINQLGLHIIDYDLNGLTSNQVLNAVDDTIDYKYRFATYTRDGIEVLRIFIENEFRILFESAYKTKYGVAFPPMRMSSYFDTWTPKTRRISLIFEALTDTPNIDDIIQQIMIVLRSYGFRGVDHRTVGTGRGMIIQVRITQGVHE